MNTRKPALHEILAVEADKTGTARRIMEESVNVLGSKHNLFVGMTKSLTMDTEGHESLEKASSVNQEITTTVLDRIDYTNSSVSDWLNVVCTKERANQNAVADIVIGDKVILPNLPATFLLGLETKLKDIRKYYEAIPTLQPGVRWISDDNAANTLDNIFISADTEVKAKTQKMRKYHTISEATKEHKAQVDITSEEVVVGQFKTRYTSGMIPAGDKSKLLTNIDILMSAVKQARQRANSVEVDTITVVGEELFKFIHS